MEDFKVPALKRKKTGLDSSDVTPCGESELKSKG